MTSESGDGAPLPYDKHSRESIVHYAMELQGSTLREKAGANKLADIQRNKGSFGSAVEYHYFKIDNNSVSAPDFQEAGIELKTTPLKRLKNNALAAKERLVIGMIDYMSVVDETFETSHFLEKSKNILLISYLWEPNTDPLDYPIELVRLIDFLDLPEADLVQIKADWETIVDKVRNGRAHEISGSDTFYLEACTKAANSSVRRDQPFSSERAKPRAWALKASFMTAMSNRLIENAQAISRSESEERLSLSQLIENRFAPYLGLTEAELGERFGYLTPGKRKPKNLCALITRRILGVADDARIDEFEKANVVPKTMRIKRNGMPKESVSFPRFDYFDVAEKPYAESSFAHHIEQKYLFVIYREDDEGDYRLAEAVFWQMPDSDVEEAERCYEEMRSRIINGRAQDSVKSSENRCCHVRPHARNNEDTLPTPQGDNVVKKCFWLNAGYLKDEIARIAK